MKELNYSINTPPSYHYFFVVVAMFLHAKIIICFDFERERLCLQALCIRANIHFGPALLEC